LVGQFQFHWRIAAQDVTEEIAVTVLELKALVDTLSSSHSSVDVVVVEFFVQNKEQLISTHK